MIKWLLDKIDYYDRWVGSTDGRPAMFTRHLLHVGDWRVDLHRFVRADDAGCFHTHPANAFRIVLSGGYVEELGTGEHVKWEPGMMGKVKPELEHRIDRLLNGESSYSLWIRGPKQASIKVRGC